jgi:hypothetical protein
MMMTHITHRQMVGAASIFFGVLFLCMNGVFAINYELTGNVHQPGGNLWWSLYAIFFLCFIILVCVKAKMPVNTLPVEEDHG